LCFIRFQSLADQGLALEIEMNNFIDPSAFNKTAKYKEASIIQHAVSLVVPGQDVSLGLDN